VTVPASGATVDEPVLARIKRFKKGPGAYGVRPYGVRPCK
jgi:hypothetical protein